MTPNFTFSGLRFFRTALLICILSGFGLLAKSQTICVVNPEGCPPSDLTSPVCATKKGAPGAPDSGWVTWTSPTFSFNCGAGSGSYNFQMLWDLPESQLSKNCWEFNRVQRTGSRTGGILGIWKSTGTIPPYFTTPYLFFGGPTNVKLVLHAENNIKVSVYLIPLDGGVETLVWTFNAPANGMETDYTGTIIPPAPGNYKVKYVFETTETTNGKNNYVDMVGINTILASQTSCTGGIDFTVTGPTQGYFPVGTTTVTYTATFAPSTGNPQVTTCSFDIVVTPLKVEANDDAFTQIANPGIAGNVLVNDKVYCGQATIDNAVITVVTPSEQQGVTLHPATGDVELGNAVPNGTYTIVYRLCASGTDVCDEATVTITVEDGPLPVTGLRLNANRAGNDINLSWITVSEQNSSYFMVEKSFDGTTFSAATSLNRVNAAGTSNSQRTYNQVDRNTSAPVVYYRVRLVGRDGSFRMSNVVAVRMSQGREFRVYPNPVRNMYTIDFAENGGYRVDLISANGQRIMVQSDIQISNSYNSITLPRNNVPGGMYELRVTNTTTGKVSVSKLVFEPR